ncbi:Hydroxyacylglutathione hydrolase [Rhodobacteraceae bacterium THAF1]|uniref:hydroxyacylglutathione hydrolase n=1 Tax=Palleronia sp. THAF1 TaxID=2587842 RepID=UPI000F3DB096|nr:hydroxyacylglutathione hydrolase [Palleronia sp. THAF1]QFU07794.1 Hydroxyacylglutathione hydrolase [Palleronia sp. THAF1]VDC25609.1 Hydroxyacylglutathione hydrolase [Rhodobacteraceae bacterium THAF1]
MRIDIVTVACRSDNYAFLVRADGKTALVDAPEAAPILAELDRRDWSLDEVWITHHHADHVEGLAGLKDRFSDLHVTGGKADMERLPALNRSVEDGDSFNFAGYPVHVLDVSGHTVGHIAFHMPDADAAFTADSLMALGCGRIFEGTPEMMWNSLQKIAALPDDTVIYSGHEYTLNNAKFALTIEPDNADLQARAERVEDMRDNDEFTVPSTLAEEKATNPFLRAHLASVKEAISMDEADDISVFAEIRSRKDSF